MENMNQYIKLLPALALGMSMASCVDDAILPFAVEKPTSIAQYEYLNSYDVLKSYIDRTGSSNINPNLKLGLAASVSDFVQKGVVYEAVTTNFNEMTAGNAMKYASVVADDGTMNFSTVSNFVETAKAAGITIYGHTLGWHAQQNMTYLNGLIADREIAVDPGATEEVNDVYVDYSTLGSYTYWHGDQVDASINSAGNLLIHNPEVVDPFYNIQYHVAQGLIASPDIEYTVTVKIRATGEGYLTCCVGDWGGQQTKALAFTTDWEEVKLKFTGVDTSNGFVMFQSGNFAGDIELEWLKVTHEEAPTVSLWNNMLTNSDCESDDTSCFYATEMTSGPKAATFGAAGTGADGVGRAIVVKSGDNPTNAWDTQFFVKTPKMMMAGDKYRFSMKYRADKEAGCETQSHNEPGGYVFYNMFTNPTFSTSWQEFVYEGTISEDQAGTSGMNTIAFNLSVLPEANTYYFDDIKWELEEQGNTVPLTPEEKKDTLTWALQNWVKGMMEATGGYVTAWDLANETVSGVDNDGDGIYDLQSSENGDPSTNFYWTDYLGNLDYVRTLESSARKYFKEYGGDPSQLKLFINDFNLESWWDGNKKAKSLVEWIKRWEADGVTKIDGIGTQMHVSYILNEADQKAQEDAIVNMFEILAASGKLIKISELDMGIVDKAFGTGMKTEDVTYEQQLKMAEFYQFIITKYFEIIPKEQQYGITQWCATDSPSDSGWRPGEPVGLWDSSYKRKPTYAGFANGLAGKVVVEPSEELSQEE